MTRIAPDGKTTIAKPGSFGSLKDAHRVKLDGGWDESFEHIFDSADSSFCSLITFLRDLPRPTPILKLVPGRSFRLHLIDKGMREKLSDCIASLVVRSPYFRDMHLNLINYYQRVLGLPIPASNKPTIALNIRTSFKYCRNIMRDFGNFVVLHSEEEFIFGDGFLSNHFHNVIPHLNTRAVVPLTPNIAIIFSTEIDNAPGSIFIKQPSKTEVEVVNTIVQIYSKNEIFYRNQKPNITEYFSEGTHNSLTHDEQENIRDIIDEARWQRA